MRVTKEQAAKNRQRIIEIASQLFREQGFDGIGVADLMKQSGFTHGGFYGHFDSKEELMTEACTHAGSGLVSQLRDRVNDASENPLAAVIQSYLTMEHCEHPGQGCVVVALGSEASRHGEGVNRALTDSLRELFDLLASIVPGRTKAARFERALSTYASMVGAMVLARSVDDPVLAEQILQSVSKSILGSSLSSR